MAFTNAWVETDPDGNVIFVSQLDDSIRTAKGAVRERLEGDPAAPDLTGLMEVGSFGSAPKPRKGAARLYVDTEANILGFGVTKREDGRMAIASDTKRLYHVATAAVVEIAYVPTAGGVMSGALIVDEVAGTFKPLEVRSNSVVHGMTDIADTNTYGLLDRNSPSAGGLLMRGLTDSLVGVQIVGDASTADGARSAAASGSIVLSARRKSGSGSGDHGADANMVVVRNNTTTKFILDADGDSHQDVGTAWTNFDRQDDVELLNRLAAHVTRKDDPLRKGFGEWLVQSRDELESLRLVSFNNDGHHFVNMSRLAMLHTGALRQLGQRLSRMERALSTLIGSSYENPQLQG